ncbi:hypothetical protein ACJJTC_004935 [Scirpophaga incertulas]
MTRVYIILFILVSNISFISTSVGDRSPTYQNNVLICMRSICKKDGFSFNETATKDLDIWTRLLWNCRDECRYRCMWRSVRVFDDREFTVPKFHGKWPFRRMFGVQEPGSAVASLLNLMAYMRMSAQLSRQFPVRTVPYVIFWHIFTLVCMNAWVWSIIFHTRDTPFTEFMDYASALSMVMAYFIAAFVRIFLRFRKLVGLMIAACLLYYGMHVQYLYGGFVDYDYNMRVNLAFGIAGGLLWGVWGSLRWLTGGVYRHGWRVAVFAAATAAGSCLELMDFPPLLNVWDAHALWHLQTAPLPLLFYRYVIDDIHFLRRWKYTEKTVLMSST